MSRQVRIIGVLTILALGFIVQGLMAPSMAARITSSLNRCYASDVQGLRSGPDHLPMSSTCEISCPAPAVLPALGVLASAWHGAERLPVIGGGLAVGQLLAPDPPPPKPVVFA